MSYVIKTENLGKSYTIGHQRQEGYQTLRDSLMHTGRGLWQRVRHPLSPNREQVDIEEFWALRDICLEIRQGDRIGIIGRNGAGKSTLLKILSRITEPTEGRVRIRGRVASLLEVGTGFHRELTGRENIFLNGAVLGMTRREIKKKFDEIVAFAEVDKFLDTPVKRYSSGMYVRLAFAVAAHLEPEILIVDEVLAVGDAQFQKKCLGKMEDVGKEGRTVLFVSHNMGAITQLTNRAALIQAGCIQFDGNVQSAISLYLKNAGASDRKKVCNIKTKEQEFAIEFFEFADMAGGVQYKSPLRFMASFDLEKDYREVTVAVGIYNSIGSRILTAKNIIPKIERGIHEYNFMLEDHHLPPGEYSASLGISSTASMIIYIENLISFSISDAQVTDPLLMPYLANHRDKIGAFFELKFIRDKL